jgi:phosphate transport system substrate-binding protein
MRVLGSLVISVIILFVGFYGTVITLLSTGRNLYGLVTAVFVLMLLVFANLLVWGQFSKKGVRYSFIGLLSCFILFVVFENVKGWHLKSLQVMSTQDVDLSVYEPFEKDSLVATLDTPATLQLEEPLLKLDGSTALYPVYSAFAQAIYPERLYDSAKSYIQSTQTSGAWENLLKEERELIFVPEPPTTVQNHAKSKGVELELTPIGKEAFVFFVHKDNPVSDVSLEEVQKIYAGEITNWKELGGKDEPILAFQRPEDSGSQQMLKKVMGTKRLMEAPKEQHITGMGGIIEETLNYENRKNAIGFSFRFFSETMVQNNKIKHLSINGVSPSIKSIQQDSYPFVSPFYAVHLSSANNPNLVTFLEWIKSEEGQMLVEKTGYVPFYK